MAHRVGVRMRIVRNQESHCVGYFSVRCMGRYDVMAPVHISPIKRLAPMHRSHGMQSGSGVTADSLLRESTSCVSSLSAPGDTSTMCPRKRVRSRSGATAGSARSSATPARTIARRGSSPLRPTTVFGPTDRISGFVSGSSEVSYDVGPQLSHRSRDAFIMDLRAVVRSRPTRPVGRAAFPTASPTSVDGTSSYFSNQAPRSGRRGAGPSRC